MDGGCGEATRCRRGDGIAILRSGQWSGEWRKILNLGAKGGPGREKMKF